MGNTKDMHRKSDSLRKFSGNATDFSSWTEHMIDHMSKVHPAWRYVLGWIATTEFDLSYAALQGYWLGPFREDAVDLACKFEQVVVAFLSEKLYLRRAQLAGGKSEKGNGFAMWRRLHREFTGESEVID